MSREASLLLFGLLTVFFFSNIRVTFIGNRSYSMYYESHALVERKGILKLIYYKPKHFHRYSIWEVLLFFYSYLVLIVLGIMFGIGFIYPFLHTAGLIATLCCMGLFIIAEFTRVICIDIQSKKEDKYHISPTSNADKLDLSDVKDKWTKDIVKNTFIYGFTIHNQLIGLYEKRIKKAKGDINKIDTIDKEFIQYYRDYQKISIEKDKVVYKTDEK